MADVRRVVDHPQYGLAPKFVLGGGSRVLNLDRHLSEELNVKVVRGDAVTQALRGVLPIEAVQCVRKKAAPELGPASSRASV